MKKPRKQSSDRDTMRPEYDFSGAVRGKYAGRFSRDVVMVVLEPDVAAAYPDAKAVNRALRAILDAAPSKPNKRRRTA
jgi:hypothetical protein